MIRFTMLMLILLGISFIALLFYSLYKKEKKEKKKLKKELNEEINRKALRELTPVSLKMSDKKMLMKIFKEKIKWMSFLKETKDYVFYYKRGEYTLSGINKDYAVIEVKVRKLKLKKEEFFNVSINAWKKENDFKEKNKPDKDLIDLLCKKEVFNSQILAALNKFFNNPSNTNNITIETN